MHDKLSKTGDPAVGSTRLVLRPSHREIIEELRGEVQVYRSSYREIDGQVRNVAALRTIAALKAAIQIIRRQNEKLTHEAGDQKL